MKESTSPCLHAMLQLLHVYNILTRLTNSGWFNHWRKTIYGSDTREATHIR